ncbi:MAG: hypothetical protein K0U76_10510 [Actinomycetia bacterium]|nr:hypothetical protein [Actinomycetes bacterium]MCH9701801.1 hypothetical protein [Actinomycetes bacterium]MCH9760499.1 hypothetical protein [Actinomycetes bacterium]
MVWRIVVVFLFALAMVVGTLAGLTLRQPSGIGTHAAAPFAKTSPWRQPIPPNPMVDPDSASMIAYATSERALIANLVEFGIPIYDERWGTRFHEVDCDELGWGICPFAGQPVFIPDGAEPNSGSDGVLVTIHTASGKIFEFWQAEKSADQWSTSWGAVNRLHGSGWGGSATGAGASRLAGVIRVAEIEAGEIPHALALQSNNACPTFRAPALKSDGTSTRADCIPEGARLQLDPSLDLSKLDLTPGELAVATAMQRYGGYVMDVGGAPLSVSFELDTDAAPGTVGATYEAAGFRWDYDAMENVPWEMLRVLK